MTDGPFDRIAARVWRPGVEFSPARTRALLARCGDPQDRVRVAHVGGTNGKGSVVAMMDAALREAGHRVGRFTSPHLVRYEEQVRIDGRTPDAKVAERFLAEHEAWIDAQPEPATGFEMLTAMAFDWWARERVDVAVVEVGLGGARDATNVVARPLVTAVTNVTNDHLAVLGPTLADVAREKAGIARRGVPFVTAAEGEARDALIAEADRLGADPIRVHGYDFMGQAAAGGVRVDGLRREYPVMRLALAGAHQVPNAAVAVAALDALDDAGVAVRVDAVARGLAGVRWPGRLTRVDGAPALLLDGAHNPAGVAALVAHLKERDLRPTLLFGCLADKDWFPMVAALAERAEGAVVTVPSSPRALPPAETAREFSRQGVPATVVPDVANALRTAQGQAGEDGLVLVCGSLYLVGDVMRILGLDA